MTKSIGRFRIAKGCRAMALWWPCEKVQRRLRVQLTRWWKLGVAFGEYDVREKGPFLRDCIRRGGGCGISRTV